MTYRATPYPGQYLDQETGLHQNYFRDYDPKTGRYIQPDLIGLTGGINPYLYINANPVNFTDRFGLLSDQEIAQLVFRETAGLRSQRKKTISEIMLDEARRRIAGIADEDPDRVGDPLVPDMENPIEKREYNKSLCAAKKKISPGKTRHFVIWPSIKGKTPDPGMSATWPYDEKDNIKFIYGPFRDVSAPGLSDKYIFFYTGVK